MAKTNFNLLTDRFKSIRIVAPTGGLVAGEMVKVGDVVGVTPEAADEGADAILIYEAEEIQVDCVERASSTLAAGKVVYFDATNKEVTTVATGNTLCGITVQPVAVGAEKAIISLYGIADAQLAADAARYAAHA